LRPVHAGRVPFLGGLLVLALALTGCFRVETAINVKDDGSGTVGMLIAIDSSVMKQLCKSLGSDCPGGTGSDFNFSASDIDKASLPPGAKVESYKDGNFQGARVTAAFSKPEEIAGLIDELSASDSSHLSLGGSGSSSTNPARSPTSKPGSPTRAPTPASSNGKMFRDFSLVHDGASWRLDATVPAPNALAGDSSDLLSGGLGEAFASSLLKNASFTVSAKLPGKVTKSNADSIAGDGTMTWKLDLTSNQPRTLSAVSATGGGSSSHTALLVVIAIAIVAALAIGFAFMRRRTPTAPAPPTDATLST
jgi:hypothetical protein